MCVCISPFLDNKYTFLLQMRLDVMSKLRNDKIKVMPRRNVLINELAFFLIIIIFLTSGCGG